MARQPTEPPMFGACQICGAIRPLTAIDTCCEDVSARHDWQRTLFLHVTHCNDRRLCIEEAQARIAAYARGEDVVFLNHVRDRTSETLTQQRNHEQCPPPK